MTGTVETPTDTTALDAFYGDVAAADLQPLWTQTRALMTATPRAKSSGVIPYRWSWDTLSALAHRSGDLIPIERGGERRVLALSNPGLEGLPYATSTLWAAVQFLGPRETAPAHRHSPGAIRFVLEGEGVWTSVDGDPCPMAPGDLVLTPGSTWHEHHNPGDRPMVWFDGLDLPLVSTLDAVFFEPGADDHAPEARSPERSPGQQLHGHPGLRADGVDPPVGRSPLSVYSRAHTDAALSDLVERLGGPQVSVTYADPRTGLDAVPTMRCRMERLLPGTRTSSRRVVGSSVRVAFSGHGVTVVDGQRFAWGPGDMIVVPSWSAVDHEVDGPSDVFVLSDAPVIEALHLQRAETLPDHQPITA